ncbi:MAG TPA: hypothetical protein ENN17_08475 [bacterium]|nr:hypothetical protein [bacterium]
MNPFAPTLRSIYNGLDLPQPAKSRILLEISGDMEDCYQALLESGVEKKEALRQTEERFRPDSQILQALVQIHVPPITRLIDRFSREARSRWEKTVLFLLLCMVFVFAGPGLVSMQMIRDAGKYAWPVLGFALAGILIFLARMCRLHLKQSNDVRRLRDGMPFILFLGGAGVMTGIAGACTETVRFLQDVTRYPDDWLRHLVHVLTQDSAIMTLAILNAVFLGFCWFMLNRKIERIEQSEIQVLLKME